MEWQAVLLAGAAGGLVGTLLPGGTDLPSPDPIVKLLKGHNWCILAYHMLRNMALGATASFALWGLYNTNSSFESQHLEPRVLATAVVAGLVGGWVLDRLVRKEREAASNRAALDRTVEAFKEYVPVPEEQVPDDT